MMSTQPIWALGLMSGTSLDGIDAALIRTDGETVKEFGPWLSLPYDETMQARLRPALNRQGDISLLEYDLTLLHAEAVRALLETTDIKPDVIGFHGQTIVHRPNEGTTWQIGNGALLAEACGVDVVCDFRRRDVAAGGQGAPMVPLYHAALAHGLPKPLAVLNIGGVANVTYIGEELLAFDCGPGNALLNDWVHTHTGQGYDADGALAAKGVVDEGLIATWLEHPYFMKIPPKSLDRNAFDVSALKGKSAEDGAATLTAFTAASIVASLRFMQPAPKQWLVCGGGRHNPVMMEMLRRHCERSEAIQSGAQLLDFGLLPHRFTLGRNDVISVDMLGWRGDALEAEAFAFLAVRSLRGLPLSEPRTTGVSRAVTGGALYRASGSGPY